MEILAVKVYNNKDEIHIGVKFVFQAWKAKMWIGRD